METIIGGKYCNSKESKLSTNKGMDKKFLMIYKSINKEEYFRKNEEKNEKEEHLKVMDCYADEVV